MNFERFVNEAGWQGCSQVPLAGDASGRRYLRLTRRDGTHAVLMVAPTETSTDRHSTAQFLAVGQTLRGAGLSAPEVFRQDAAQGLILMEDLGDLTLARLLENAPETARAAYAAAAALPDLLEKVPCPPAVASPTPAAQAAMADLTFDMLSDSDDLRLRLLAELEQVMQNLTDRPPVLALRDYHADNLIWLPERNGAARVGLLDFQDAVILPLGYDLASLLDDVRRDLPAHWRSEEVASFADRHGLTQEAALLRIDALSLLRNLRILGIFRRLATSGKPAYRRFQPRTRALIARAAENPGLAPLAAGVAELLDRTADWATSEGCV